MTSWILYFNHMGIPIVEYKIHMVGLTWQGPQVVLQEFDYRNKLGE
jgi:hypothetical protein